MFTQIKTSFLFSTFTLLMCFNVFFLKDIAAQVGTEPISTTDSVDYAFETIDVPGVDFLSVTASSDFEDYAGYTKSADGQKDVAFTLINGMFETYDFPGSQNTYFFALGNDGRAAGYYEDSEGRHRGIILQEGELREYNFPNAVETEIYGINDATGALTGNFTDAAGVRRGFSGDTIIEYPGAVTTYADFTSAAGVVGSYIDTEGTYHAYILRPNGRFMSFSLSSTIDLDYAFFHGINDVGTYVARVKLADDVPRTYVGSFSGRHELRFPDSVSTEGYNINQDGSIVGYYDTEDGRRHGFIARPTEAPADESIATPTDSGYTYERIDVPGVDFLAVTASSDFEDYAGYTKSADGQKDVAFTLIDGVFTIYDFPGALNTYFYALGNDGTAAGYYEDSDGLYQGVILENGELREYNFPNAVETEIYGISDTTGALTGNFIDAAGVRRGFSGDIIIEFPGASATYTGFAIAYGIVGSYVDADGTFHAYLRTPDGKFESVSIPIGIELEYFFISGINNAGVYVGRSKVVGEAPRTFAGTFSGQQELLFPGSILTEGWNINQDGSVVGYYDTPDGRRHGFVASPAMDTAPEGDAGDTTPQVDTEPGVIPHSENYTFETINVPGVDFLSVTASSDFEDYAGYTKSADGEKEVAFTLIDGVFSTYDFPGSQNTYFFALGNNGDAAGYYEDSNGHHQGVVLQNGELREYNFPNAVETEVYGISDATGVLTGNFTDASGVRRGFSGDEIIEVSGAAATFADFVNASGAVVGSYVDVDGAYHPYVRNPNGKFTSVEIPFAELLEYFFIHGLNDAWTYIVRNKVFGDVPRTYVGKLLQGLEDFQFSSDQDLSLEQAIFTLHELHFPGSVSTEGYNINQDGSVVGHYTSADGRRHGFIARPADAAESAHFGNAYTVTLSKGLNMLSVPLSPPKPMTAKNLVAMTGATTIITLDTASQRFVAWTPAAPDAGFPIEGGKGYIVNVPEPRNFAFVGAPWTDPTAAAAAAPAAISTEAWAFVVSGHLEGKPAFDGYTINVRNLRTDSVITTSVQGDYFAAATADLERRSVIRVGDVIELRVIGPDGNFELQTLSFKVTPEHLANAVLSVKLDSIGQPTQNQLLQNYPNPFNPETWIPYQLSEASPVSVSIYDTTGRLIRTLSLGYQSAGFYNSRGRAAYWDGRNALGERVASGIYFYQLTTPAFQQTRRLVIVK